MRTVLLRFPGLPLLLPLTAYWVLVGVWLNPVATGLLTMLVLVHFLRPAWPGLLLAAACLLLGGYGVLALISEFGGGPPLSSAGKWSLGYGILFIGSWLAASAWMYYGYWRRLRPAPSAASLHAPES